MYIANGSTPFTFVHLHANESFIFFFNAERFDTFDGNNYYVFDSMFVSMPYWQNRIRNNSIPNKHSKRHTWEAIAYNRRECNGQNSVQCVLETIDSNETSLSFQFHIRCNDVCLHRDCWQWVVCVHINDDRRIKIATNCIFFVVFLYLSFANSRVLRRVNNGEWTSSECINFMCP